MVNEASSIDVLIERLGTHPQEFFNESAVVDRDGARLFNRVKFYSLVTVLLVDKTPGEYNLWVDLFSEDERKRFRAAFHKAVRAVIDAKVMQVIFAGEDPNAFNRELQKELDEFVCKRQMRAAQTQMAYGQIQAQRQHTGIQQTSATNIGSSAGGALLGTIAGHIESRL